MTAPRRNATAALFVAAVGATGFTLAYVARTMSAAPADRPAQWKKVDEAVNKGLPQTAVKELEPIIQSAIKDKAYPEVVKAIAKKIALEGTIQGNKPEEKITRMKAEIDRAPKEVVPVMDAILAEWYWHYFQQNRWRFVQRTQTAAPPGNDFTTWDLPRVFAEINAQFTKALAAERELKATPVAAYNALLETGTLPDAYRPTLWDFLAFEALNFYTSPEQAGAKAEDSFEFDAASPALGTVAEFLAWRPETTDENSRTLKAIRLYQNLLAFHQDDADRTAFLDADLHRLQFAYNHAVGEEKAERYKAALGRFADAHAKHELAATALFRLAEVIDGEGDRAGAREVAQRAVGLFPDSRGGTAAYNLIRQIEAKEVHVVTERVWADPLPPVRVSYRNLGRVHFRVYAADWVGRLGGTRHRPEALTDVDRAELLRSDPVAEFAADLPATPDFKTRTHDVPAPKGLKPGFYFLLGSPDPDFATENNPVAATDLWVSDLAVVTRQAWGPGEVSGFVLRANSGEPVAGAAVRAWWRDNRTSRYQPGPDVTTDQNGLFVFRGAENRSWVFLASHDGHALATAGEFYLQRNNSTPQPFGQTVIFTDRSLYRPGQTIHFKGICLRADQARDGYEVLPNRPVTLVLNDVNGQQVAQVAARTNDYGSFSGTFTAPRDRLTGRMSLQAHGDVPGHAQVSVEEYKRPKFQVELDAPKEPAKLGGAVTLAGKATAYTGAAVGGAKVRYRVAREVRYPQWLYDFYWWRVPPNPGGAQEVAHGTAVTGADGTFKVTFPAKPDRTVDPATEPVFSFSVSADVTDIDGETRTDSRTVQVGYTALQATLSAGDWLTADKETKLTVSTTTLDGEPQAAKGAVKVYALKQPAAVQRPDILGQRIVPPRPRPLPRRGREAGRPVPLASPRPAPPADPSNPRTWELGEVVATLPFETDAKGTAELTAKLPAGPFRAVLETADKFDKPVTARQQVTVLDPAAKTFGVKVPHAVAAPKWTAEPGETFTALWGTGYAAGRAFVEVEHRGEVVKAFWTEAGRTQVPVTQPVAEGMRGGFTLRITYVRENRAYIENRHVHVPWTNRQLTLKWEHFVSKLEPGKKETWTAVISGPDAKQAVAEMVAAMYDASLDQYLPHNWPHQFGVFRQDHSRLGSQFENQPRHLNVFTRGWQVEQRPVAAAVYRSFPQDITANMWAYEYAYRMRGAKMLGATGAGGAIPAPAAAPARTAAGVEALAASAAPADPAADRAFFGRADGKQAANEPREQNKVGTQSGPDLSQVAARSNLNETAFFFPHLVSGDDGTVRLEFTMPEALTRWKFLGFAHDRDLRSGFLGGETVTAKDLMVQPNPPRFLREGDVLEFTVKVTNQSEDRQAGTVRLTFADARTGRPLSDNLGAATADQAFDVPPKESRVYSWRVTVPDGLGPVTYKAVGAAAKLSDGEEGVLPVLSKRVLVTESLPLPIRGPAQKTFEFTKLLNSAKSDTIRHQALSVQVTSNPAWYAVMALPYLMEFPYECSEQTFNRLYANALARHVAGSDPKVRAVFNQWRNTPALDSPLEKNQDVKSVLLQETPWVRDAQQESQARRNVGVLFDDNRLGDELARAMKTLAEMQNADGRWPWFPGGPSNDYITLYITTGFGRLRHLGVKTDVAPAVRAVTSLDAWADKVYRDVLRHAKNKDDNHLSATVSLYLYGRSFFLADQPVAAEHQEAVSYWLGQARAHWLKLANRQSQAHLAVGLKRFGVNETPAAIMASIKERSVTNDEMGMFWRGTELSWWWYHAPIETQAMMIEAFAEVTEDVQAVEECKVWLLKQKQTQNWRTTKATADAVYALLLRGTDLLSSNALVTVTLGDTPIVPEKVEAGTGFYEQKFVRTEVKPEMGKVTMTKTDPGVAWGSVHWQYLEDISKVTPHEGTPLKVEKKLFKRTYTKAGPVLEPVAGAAQVGDEVVVRVVLRTDRDMEYVHLKDHRGSGTEPTNVLSRYRYQDGLAYYESTKDTASHFFIDYLPKGTYVFEYAVRAVHKGRYPTGMADVQCMYAPEFNSHSESIMLEVK